MNSSDFQLETFLPLREPAFTILLSLAGGEKHGYAILKTVEHLSRGKLRLSTGTLYAALSRLVDQWLIERVDAVDNERDNQRSRSSKVYRLTELGRRVLHAETERIHALVAISHLHLNERPS